MPISVKKGGGADAMFTQILETGLGVSGYGSLHWR